MRHRWRRRVQAGRKRGASHAKRNGGGCDRLRPFRIIAIWAGFVLAQCRGSTVTGAQVSCC
ncbi:unnamed protein product, partial [Ascophyllum nodosum]